MGMNNFMDTFNIPTAIADNTKLDLSCKHITTANWMQLNPIYTREMVPGEKLELGVESFTRLNPMVVPTFAPGSKLKVSRFFVPFRTIFRGWNDFITDAYHVSSTGKETGRLLTTVPYVTNATLLAALTTPFTSAHTSDDTVFAVSAGTSADTNAYDYRLEDGTKYVYTYYGRQAQKVLQSLGYKINPNSADLQIYSALPLLAYAKVYADYFWPSAYMDNYAHSYLESLFNLDGGTTLELTAPDVAKILWYTIYVCYDSDYFVSAFDNPVAPSVGNYSDMILRDYSVPDPYNMNYAVGASGLRNVRSNVVNYNSSSSGVTGTTALNGTPVVAGDGGALSVLSQYTDSMLHRLTDYMKRHQLSGSRAMERYLSRFGKALSAEKLNRSVYLGTDVTTLQIGDVMSTSDTVANSGTTGAQLGAYAGKGIAYGKNDFDSFSTDEYGMYIVTSSLVPDVFYDQGVDYNVYHVYKSEFWTPEFDYGMRAITASELVITNDGTSNYASGNIHSQVFGFTPRYSEYRVPKSKLTGSFRVPTLNGNSEFGSDAWHMMREIQDGEFGHDVTDIVHSPSFCRGAYDAGQYNRLFFNADHKAPDQFVTIFSFDVKSYAPYASLYENYDWCEDQTGRKIAMQSNGVKVN